MWKRDKGAWPLLLGRFGGIQDCSWCTGQSGFTVAQRSVSEGLPRQEASKYLRYRSGQWPRCVTPWDLYKQQWDPEPGGTKLKAQSRDQKWGKGLLWTVALPERASVGEGTKPRITKLMKAIWVEPNNKVIIQIFLFLCCCLQMRIKTTIEVANRDSQSL